MYKKEKNFGVCGIFQELTYLSELPFMRVMESLAIVACLYRYSEIY